MSGPDRAETLIQLLAFRADAEPDKEAFRFAGESQSYGKLWRSVNRLAANLLADGLGLSERVVLALPNGAEFFYVFYGVQRAGGVAVPIFPDSGVERVFQLAAHCQAGTVVLSASLPDDALERFRARGRTDSIRVLIAEDLARGLQNQPEPEFPAIQADDLAYIQYTSGSTGNPKGVQLSHANLLTNARQLIAGMEITPEEIFVSWLPVFHDMGLVLMTLVPFYLGARLILLPAVLTNIRGWLTEIEANGGTFTAAPDFAYRLCLRYVKDPGEHDLSSLRVALNAAEPVRRGTIEEFEAAFDLDRVMMPGYGLAEATVGVSMWAPGTKVKVDERGVVSVGKPFPEIEIAILEQDGSPELCAVGSTGEVLVKSPANTRGYLDNPEASAGLFWSGFVRTGDVGYVDAEGHLFIVGRKKSIIIQAGRNIAPREIEEVVDALPFVRYSAAVGVDRGGLEGEQAYVFAELREHKTPSPEECEERSIAIVQAIHSHLGLRPGRVYLAAPKTIPLTHNGKIRHLELARQYRDGNLRARGQLLFPSW
ncbi:MAG: fatty acyl-AMP ligase [bacterium]|nr:fatty acyl-AMP ligase [bacterium]